MTRSQENGLDKLKAWVTNIRVWGCYVVEVVGEEVGDGEVGGSRSHCRDRWYTSSS